MERQNIGRIREKIAAKILRHLGLGQLAEIFRQLVLARSPGEIGITLGEPRLGQHLHHFRSSEGLREKNCVRKFLTDARDQEFPKGYRFGVWIIDPKDADAALRPEENSSFHLLPEFRPVRAAEIQR